jgi:hypothetical protein
MMASAIRTIAPTSIHAQRLAIAHDSDARLQSTAASVMDGFALDWPAILGAESLTAIEDALRRELRSVDFRDTVAALAINGAAVAAWTLHRNEILAGLKTHVHVDGFAETIAVATPTKALAYWQRFLGLTDQQTQKLGEVDTRDAGAVIADRIADELMTRLRKLHDQTVRDSLPLSEFVKQAREIAPDQSRALLETEFRTHLAETYGEKLHEQIVSRASAFPFTQYFVIKDDRTTWWICLPMGTAGPNGTGYIAATGDQTWITWRTPAHWRCRSMHSPISYREAQRLGILASDGRTKIALIGSNPDRPYGDPPKFATGPNGVMRKVEPQEGFGG